MRARGKASFFGLALEFWLTIGFVFFSASWVLAFGPAQGAGINFSQIGQHLLPTTTNTYDVGSASKAWRTGYFATVDLGTPTITASGANVVVLGDVLPSADSTYDLGASGTEWAQGHFDALNAATSVTTPLVTLSGTGTTSIAAPFGIINFAAGGGVRLQVLSTGIQPGGDNTLDSGSASFSWRTGYFDTSVQTPQVTTASGSNLTLNATNGTTIFSTAGTARFRLDNDDFRAAADNTADLGQSALRFRNVYVGTGIVTPLIVTADADGVALSATTDNFKWFTNEGATARADSTLPAAAAGLAYGFVVQDADGIQVTAASGDTIRLSTAVSAAAGNIQSTTIGSTVWLVAINATEWVALSFQGTWTVN